jgi:cytochrome c oxidase subunit 2
LKKIFTLFTLLATLLGCPWSLLAQEAATSAAPTGMSPKPKGAGIILENISTYGHEIDDLFYLILIITTIVAVVVLGIMIYCMVKFRYREGRRSTFTHGSKTLEVGWTVATSAILFFIAIIQKDTWDKVKIHLPDEEKSFLVRVLAERFAWNFVYPGADGTFEPNDDTNIFPGINPMGLRDYTKDIVRQDLIVPRDTPVILELVSKGKFDPNTGAGEVPVLHSFFSPHLRLKQDIVPYYPQKVWFRVLPNTDGTRYEIVCAELCGQGHYQMNAQMRILAEPELQSELGYDWKAQPARFDSSADQGKQGD